jgi:hypothetical protein
VPLSDMTAVRVRSLIVPTRFASEISQYSGSSGAVEITAFGCGCIHESQIMNAQCAAMN